LRLGDVGVALAQLGDEIARRGLNVFRITPEALLGIEQQAPARADRQVALAILEEVQAPIAGARTRCKPSTTSAPRV
jgi:hypothetical protein